MNRNLRHTVLLLVGLSFAPTLVQADILKLKLRPGPGGELQVKPISGFTFVPEGMGMVSAGLFPTFSVEKGRTGGFHRRYFAVLNDEAVGSRRRPTTDPLDPKTAYLYQRFIDGDLSGYSYGPKLARIASATA